MAEGPEEEAMAEGPEEEAMAEGPEEEAMAEGAKEEEFACLVEDPQHEEKIELKLGDGRRELDRQLQNGREVRQQKNVLCGTASDRGMAPVVMDTASDRGMAPVVMDTASDRGMAPVVMDTASDRELQRTNSNSALDTCNLNNLNNFSSLILNAVNNTTHQLQCISTNNASFPPEKLHMLQKELGKIITSTLNVIVQLGASSAEDIADSFGALHTLTVENANNVEFVQSWLCVRLVPILPFITTEFISNMSKKNFSCVSYQAIVKALSQQVDLVNMALRPFIYTNFIHPFLSREVSGAKNLTYIENTEVRDIMLNLTLSALAPKFPLFQTSDYELWFQINLVVLLASFSPSVLLVIPANLSCDSHDAILKGLEKALAGLPSDLQEDLKSSKNVLLQSPPEGCTPPPPVRVCKETLVDEKSLCQGVNSGPTEAQLSTGNLPGLPCSFSLSEYACSSVGSLSSDQLATLLTCELPSSASDSAEMWKLFFQKVAGVLENALSEYSNITIHNNQPDSHVLDAIGEVEVNNFSAAQLTDVSFIGAWFQERLKPFLPAVSGDFLSCLSSKNFSCDTYQVVVKALSSQASLMEEEQRRAIFTEFIHPFLSRNELADPACLSKTPSSAEWLEKNFANFSSYATLADLQTLNENFSSFELLAMLTPTQAAELTLSSGALNNTNQINTVFDRLEEGNAFKNVDEFLTALSAAPEIPDIITDVRDVMMNRTFKIIQVRFQDFEAADWVAWFTVKLIPILPSFTAEMLVTITAEVNCTNYHVIVEGLSLAYAQTPVKRREELAAGLLSYLKMSANQINQPACRQDVHNDTDWLILNLGQFFTYVPFSELIEFNISRAAVLVSLSGEQKVERLLTPGLIEDESAVRELFGTIVNSPDQKQLDEFFGTFISISAQRNVSSISAAVRSTILNMTLTDLLSRYESVTPQTFALWFQTYLLLFLPGMGPHSLSVIPTTISCDSYREIVKGCDGVFSSLTQSQKEDVYRFIHDYLSRQPHQGQSCVQTLNSDSDWLLKNFGQFSVLASFTDLISLKRDFNGVEAAKFLTPLQLAELCSSPSRLHRSQDVQTIMNAVAPQQLSHFFDVLSPKIQVNESSYSAEVKHAFLQAVFARGGLSSPSISDSEVSIWLTVRLKPLLSVLSLADVTDYFDLVRTRGCSINQEAVSVLDSLRMSLNEDTQRQIYNSIKQLLTDPAPLRCYGSGSFYLFLKTSFLHFGFPDLNSVLSLIPVSRRPEVLSSISTAEMSEFLNGPQTLVDGSGLCDLLGLYNRTTQYLETERVGSVGLARQVLSCVWSQVLKVNVQSEVDQWFDYRLVQYLPFLTSQLISPAQLSGATCVSYRKLVSVLGNNYNFSNTDFTAEDVYSSIKVYLANDGSPRCYEPSNSQLNATNWIVSYIGVFISYVNLTDLNSFVSSGKIGVFLENSGNLELLNSTTVQSSVISYYITQLYIQNPSFNPIRLPGAFLCGISPFAFEILGAADSLTLIKRLNVFCNGTEDPAITVALTANLPTISSATIQLLGNQSISLTVGQISSTSSSIIAAALPTLGTAVGWNQGQANAIIQTLTASGFTISTGSSLVSLGSLVTGVQSETISSISSSELLTISNNPTFINNIASASAILQLVYVMKIVSIDETKVIENVPDVLAGSIPRVLLASLDSLNVTLINQKQWTQEQAVMLFGSMASANEDAEELSEEVLQGFTCTSVQTLDAVRVQQMVKACRHRQGRKKVQLKESQLMCMNNYMKDDPMPNFTELPTDMLLYYSYEKVEKSKCRSYFSAVGSADFSVLSGVLGKQTTLFNNAQNCLGISGQSLSKDDVEVLGNMTCTLDPVYIENSHPIIIESLKNCDDLSDAQISAVETLLLSGNTTYGSSSVWNQETLERLDILPLYFTDTFWKFFSPTVKRKYLKGFMPSLRKKNTEKPKLKKLFSNCNSELDARTRTARSTDCTAGNITEATIADPSFPFGYSSIQFDACLHIRILTDNLAAITEKVDDSDFQRIILNKLNQVYPAGLSDSVLQVLAGVSRQATVNEIKTWSITTIDTLTALMDQKNGAWDRLKSKEVILQYLSISGHTLGTNELNVIRSNLCTLDVSALKNITAESLRNADTPDLSSCSSEQKSVLYVTANASFRAQNKQKVSFYHLISPFLGGAPVEDVRALASENISMDISTFRSLDLSVITNLSVSEVRSLMGVGVADLKVFENDSVVQTWISSQLQPQLDTLNLGLRGGRADPSTPVTIQPNTSFPNTSFPNASFPNTSFPNASFPNTSSPTTSLPNTSSSNTSLPNTSFPNASSPNTSSPTTSLPNTSLPNASSSNASSPNASSPTTSIPKASLPNTSLPNGSLPNASSPNASFPNASLPNASLPNASSPTTSIPKASLPNTSLPNGSLPNASSPNASFPNASLPNASLPNASSPTTSIPKASLPNTSLPNGSLPNASSPNASFPNASLSNASLPNASLPNTTTNSSSSSSNNNAQTTALSQSASSTDAEHGSASVLHLASSVWFITSCVWLLTFT
ncbi:uncharacterized protein LOC127651975 [Xyrauchen texanus]|uniref:uncharacterized protein LOC127651975 n=1 Tax=Xyrauchen texanus TaxID=154827 RepID=UPI002242164C|nr:uncharacterized protein LOC127651975 [Xyrauchen texanus]